jgi:putative ATPase
MGHGADYRNPHDFPDHITRQRYMPDELVGRTFYTPTDAGHERTVRERQAWWEKKLRERGE